MGSAAVYNYPMLSRMVDRLIACERLEEATAVLTSSVNALLDADGACVVLREGDQCYYADENAIARLWKGNRYPVSACISGWCMEQRETVSIPDVYSDARIPHSAYRATFVKSLLVTPIQPQNPIGVLGAYWAVQHAADEDERYALETLAAAAGAVIARLKRHG